MLTVLHRLRFTIHFLRHRTDPNYLAVMALVHTNTRQLIYEVWRKETMKPKKLFKTTSP